MHACAVNVMSLDGSPQFDKIDIASSNQALPVTSPTQLLSPRSVHTTYHTYLLLYSHKREAMSSDRAVEVEAEKPASEHASIRDATTHTTRFTPQDEVQLTRRILFKTDTRCVLYPFVFYRSTPPLLMIYLFTP
jgi:hypothetical protein